jgi:predicted GNAT family N-acyltransferase
MKLLAMRNNMDARTAAVTVKRVASPQELAQAYAIRMRVFVDEQGVPGEIELDRDDARALHFLAHRDGRPVGTARLSIRRSNAKIGRMAVLQGYRRKGVGGQLLSAAVALAKRSHAKKIYLHAQVAVLGFYERFGFVSMGPVFDEAGIPHRKMVLLGRGAAPRQGRNRPRR